MDIQLIDNNLLSSLHKKASENERLRINYDMRTSTADLSQRMLNALEPGTVVPIHRHEVTTETVICLEGSFDEIFYSEDTTKDTSDISRFTEIARYTLCPREGKFGIQIPKGMWHTIEVKEPSTIFEAKDGPYIPAKK